MLESIVAVVVISTFTPYLIQAKHRFTRGRSTETNRLVYDHFISDSLENGSEIGSIYTDLYQRVWRVDYQFITLKTYN